MTIVVLHVVDTVTFSDISSFLLLGMFQIFCPVCGHIFAQIYHKWVEEEICTNLHESSAISWESAALKFRESQCLQSQGAAYFGEFSELILREWRVCTQQNKKKA